MVDVKEVASLAELLAEIARGGKARTIVIRMGRPPADIAGGAQHQTAAEK